MYVDPLCGTGYSRLTCSQEQCDKIQRDIDAADTSKLEPGLCETDFIQALVMQFLQHDGYVETARAFAEDLRLQNEALSSNTGPKVSSINIRDDEDANNRQRKWQSRWCRTWAEQLIAQRHSTSDSRGRCRPCSQVHQRILSTGITRARARLL